MTLVGTTKAVMRKRMPDGSIVVRALLGQELLAMQGWHFNDYATADGSELSHTVLSDLAGNAFSAFALGVVLLAAIPAVFLEPLCGSLSRCDASADSDLESESGA